MSRARDAKAASAGKRAPPRPPAKRARPARRAPTAVEEPVRLQKFLASAGVASRRKAEELIVGGLVKVNGRVVTELGTRIVPGTDKVSVRGHAVEAQRRVYFLLNKPDAIVSSAQGTADEEGRPTVLSLLHGVTERVFPVGRLDYHSRGLLLLTNDGELAGALTHPRHRITKTYHVKFQGKLGPEALAALEHGVVLDDGTKTAPATELLLVKETSANTWLQLGIDQGLNRQIRRMGDAIGHPVLKLIRVAIGDLDLEGVEEGEFRPLTATEVAQLRHLVQEGAPPPGASRGRARAERPRKRTG